MYKKYGKIKLTYLSRINFSVDLIWHRGKIMFLIRVTLA